MKGVVFDREWPGKAFRVGLKEVKEPECRYPGDESTRQRQWQVQRA